MADGGEVFTATIEAPVTISNPEKPIGTHVFTAMARNDAGLRWTAVTIDNGDDADVPVASGNNWGNDGFGFFFQRNWNSQLAIRRPILSTDATALVLTRHAARSRMVAQAQAEKN